MGSRVGCRGRLLQRRSPRAAKMRNSYATFASLSAGLSLDFVACGIKQETWFFDCRYTRNHNAVAIKPPSLIDPSREVSLIFFLGSLPSAFLGIRLSRV